MSTRPAVQIARAPNRATSAGASRADGIIAAAIGSMLTAETSADVPPNELQILQNRGR